MAASREIRLSVKDRLFTTVLRLGLAVGVLGLTIVLFGFLLPAMSRTPGLRFSREDIIEKTLEQRHTFDSLWSNQRPFFALAFDLMVLLGLAVLSLWCLHKAFLYLCARLDEHGFWNRVIARRDPRHHGKF